VPMTMPISLHEPPPPRPLGRPEHVQEPHAFSSHPAKSHRLEPKSNGLAHATPVEHDSTLLAATQEGEAVNVTSHSSSPVAITCPDSVNLTRRSNVRIVAESELSSQSPPSSPPG
jgi:hypothetical protein